MIRSKGLNRGKYISHLLNDAFKERTIQEIFVLVMEMFDRVTSSAVSIS